MSCVPFIMYSTFFSSAESPVPDPDQDLGPNLIEVWPGKIETAVVGRVSEGCRDNTC